MTPTPTYRAAKEADATQAKVARFLCSLFDDDWSEGKGWHMVNARRLLDMIGHHDLRDACAEFVRKVDAGEARSKRSYAQMKAALAKAAAARAADKADV